MGLGIALAVWFEIGSGEWAYTPNWDIKAGAGVLFFGDYVGTPAIPLVILIMYAVATACFAGRHIVAEPVATCRR